MMKLRKIKGICAALGKRHMQLHAADVEGTCAGRGYRIGQPQASSAGGHVPGGMCRALRANVVANAGAVADKLVSLLIKEGE